MQLYLFPSSLDRGKAKDALIEIKQASCSHHDFPRHSHEEFQISLMQAGYASHFYRGARTGVGPGNVTIFQTGEAHSNQTDPQHGSTYDAFLVPPRVIRELIVDISNGRTSELPYFDSTGVLDDGTVRRNFVKFTTAAISQRESLRTETRLIHFLDDLIQRFAYPRIARAAYGTDRSVLRKARDYLRSHFTTKISLEALAKASGLSRYHFLRQFEKLTGIPPHQYQIQLRIAKAKELLRDGWEPALVASEVGFADQSHLYRYFKRLVGITPGQFIRAVRS